MYIGQNINVLRKQKKMSQSELGDILDVHSSAISAYEKGKNLPSAEKILRLAEYFQVSLDSFVYQDLSQIEVYSDSVSEPKVGYGADHIPLYFPRNTNTTSLEQEKAWMQGYIQLPSNDPVKDLVAIYVTDNELFPDLFRGDIAICKRENDDQLNSGKVWYLMGKGIRAGFYRVDAKGKDGLELMTSPNRGSTKVKKSQVVSKYRVVRKVTEEGIG